MGLHYFAHYARTAVLAMAVIFAALLASQGTANASCDKQSGKMLYTCLANKLDHVAAMSYRSPETQAALQTAAAKLRVATSKSQALSAIAQCRSVVAGVIQKVKSAGQNYSGLDRVSTILANAARLIQEKG